MSSGAHIELRKRKDKSTWFLEIGWDEAEVAKVIEPFCLTKPYEGGSLNRPHSGEWSIWNLKKKKLIAEFQKEKDAREYFDYLIGTRQ